MILYTIIPPEVVFDQDESPDLPGSCATGSATKEMEIEQGKVKLVVEPHIGGMGKITRVISTDPADYLDPRWQPGMMVNVGALETVKSR